MQSTLCWSCLLKKTMRLSFGNLEDRAAYIFDEKISWRKHCWPNLPLNKFFVVYVIQYWQHSLHKLEIQNIFVDCSIFPIWLGGNVLITYDTSHLNMRCPVKKTTWHRADNIVTRHLYLTSQKDLPMGKCFLTSLKIPCVISSRTNLYTNSYTLFPLLSDTNQAQN